MRKTLTAIGAVIVSASLGITAVLATTEPANPNDRKLSDAIGEQSVTFSVAKMTCAACPLTVKKAMRSVAGVKSVNMDFDAKIAEVVFDPSATSPADIAAASMNAGYPATPVDRAEQ